MKLTRDVFIGIFIIGKVRELWVNTIKSLLWNIRLARNNKMFDDSSKDWVEVLTNPEFLLVRIVLFVEVVSSLMG